MCGRYALGIRAAFVRHQLQNYGMPVDDVQDDDDARETFNFAPGNYGLIYRVDVPDTGARAQDATPNAGEDSAITTTTLHVDDGDADKDTIGRPKYKLQAMKWGLIPFWTKRNPDYGSMLKTINCRDDSLMENRGMWTTMKKGKRCIVIAQGFYEWLKKNGGKEKIPHYTKRKDGQLMCFAGLWDCVQYEGSEEKHYTYTIITTDSNEQLKFLHDRMPVILENGSEGLQKWLDPKRTEWTKELQYLLKPFTGELECYPVTKKVGKVGNNSADFLVPVDSSENKQNIANFFNNAKSPSKTQKMESMESVKPKQEDQISSDGDQRKTIDVERSEDNAPMPAPTDNIGSKRNFEAVDAEETTSKETTESPIKKKVRSATSNKSAVKSTSPKSGGNQRITNFFGK